MDRNKIIFLGIAFIFFCLDPAVMEPSAKKPSASKMSLLKDTHASSEAPAAVPVQASHPFEEGERFTYQINYKGLPVGTSLLTFEGAAVCQGYNLWRITFNTGLPLIKDEEILYAHKETFLPACVSRTIHKVGNFPEKIEEVYDQKNYTVTVTKSGKFFSKKTTIRKTSSIHNAILLAYYYRTVPDLEKSLDLAVTLPTFEFTVQYRGKELLKTPLGQMQAHVFISSPPKFKLWISADGKRIPLKIENPSALGYSLELKSIDYLSREAEDFPKP